MTENRTPPDPDPTRHVDESWALRHVEVLLVDQLAQSMQMRGLPPDPQRDEAIASLHRIRNHLAHSRSDRLTDGTDLHDAAQPVLAQVLAHLRRVDRSSLGTRRARGIRRQTPPEAISEILNRADSSAAEPQPAGGGNVEQTLRDAADAGEVGAMTRLADWLGEQPDRDREVEQAYRDAAAAGESPALFGLAAWLRRHPDREDDVEQVYRDAAAEGRTQTGALIELADWLRTRPGRLSDSLQIYYELVALKSPR